MLELASDSMFTPQPPTQDHQSWVREANIDKLIGPLCLDKRDGAVTERDTSSTRSRYLSPRRVSLDCFGKRRLMPAHVNHSPLRVGGAFAEEA
jgi:hypothetical protein